MKRNRGRYSVVEEIARQTKRRIHQELSPSALRSRAFGLLSGYGSLLEELPSSLRSLLDQVRAKELGLTLSHTGLDRFTAALIFASRLLATALLVSALLVAGSIVLLAGRDLPWIQQLGLIALGCAVVFGGAVVVRHFRYKDSTP